MASWCWRGSIRGGISAGHAARYSLPMTPARIAFGPFELDPERSTLLRNGSPVPIGQRAAAVLAVLASARGKAVTKADLLAGAWPDVIVEEGNLTVQIAALRKALGTTADGQSWILTLPREGYRLLSAGAGAANDDPSGPRGAAVPCRRW